MIDVIAIYAAIIGTFGLFLTIYINTQSNKLKITLDINSKINYADAKIMNIQRIPIARYFHIMVKNNHKRKTAKNCKAYMTSIKENNSDLELMSTEVPLKWSGYQSTMVAIDIPPMQDRKFDAFFVFHQKPDELQLNAFIDSTSLMPKVSGERKLKINFKVTADNFKTKEISFLVTLSQNLNNVAINSM